MRRKVKIPKTGYFLMPWLISIDISNITWVRLNINDVEISKREREREEMES